MAPLFGLKTTDGTSPAVFVVLFSTVIPLGIVDAVTRVAAIRLSRVLSRTRLNSAAAFFVAVYRVLGFTAVFRRCPPLSGLPAILPARHAVTLTTVVDQRCDMP
jgi:hypothetical protein